MSQDKVFADGFIFKRRENAPEFVIGNISVKVEEAVEFLNQHKKNGWVNLNVLNSKGGKPYIELDQFVPKSKQEPQESKQQESKPQDSPSQELDPDLPF